MAVLETASVNLNVFEACKCWLQAKPCELKVEGQIPSWLNGSLVRNGPGFFAPEMLHLFDGYGMLLKYTFENGRVFTMQRQGVSAYSALRGPL